MNKKEIALIVVMVLLSIVLVIGGTYAFYIANITGNDTAEDITIASGYLELTFAEDGNNITMENAFPNSKGSKTFTVENTSTVSSPFTYNIKLSEVETDFEQKDLVYELQEYTDGNYDTPKEDGINATGYINAGTVNEQGEMYLAINISAPAKGSKQYYKLTIEFKETNENQDYNQGKSFTGKINGDDNKDAKLYEEQKENPFTKIMKVDNITIFDDDPGNNIRYVGQDPSNYIWFNCDDYDFTSAEEAASKNCEKWRIIGLFKDITKEDNTKENLVKIVRSDSIGNIAWDSGSSNDWTNASLQVSLNGDYLNPNDNGTYTNVSTIKAINAATLGMIESVQWNLGAPSGSNVSEFYFSERGDETYQSSRPTIWTGEVGLIYPSDFAYSSDGGYRGRDYCLSKFGWQSWDAYTSSGECPSFGWLGPSERMGVWTLSPSLVSGSSAVVLQDLSGGDNFGVWTQNSASSSKDVVFPSLYLKSSVKINGGEGTKEEPYILSVNS